MHKSWHGRSQWPDDYNWESTRAINTPAPRKDTKDTLRSSNEDLGSKEKDLEFEVKDASSSEDPFDTTDDDLDPVALNKAFRFASISSLTLVSNLTKVVLFTQFDARFIISSSS